MKKSLTLLLLLLAATVLADKRVYIPNDLRGIDLNDSTSRWSWRNSAQTADLVFFWERPFGADPTKAPDFASLTMFLLKGGKGKACKPLLRIDNIRVVPNK